MIYPDRLNPGDKIAIVSPATTVKEEYIDGAVGLLRSEGFLPVVMPSAKGPADGSYASSLENRVSDLRSTLHDSEIKAILCARGGYGCIHLLPFFSDEEIRHNPKWLIGFSDVSALHALWHRAGVASIHGPMAKHLALSGRQDVCTSALLNILKAFPAMFYRCAPHPFNRTGKACGRLLGGNLAVLDGLASTGFDMMTGRDPDGVVLFLEDIAEPIYKVERMLTRLYISGALQRLRGLIIGRFTEYNPDRNHASMENMIDALLRGYGLNEIPVAFGFPVGHVDVNLPLIEGDMVELSVDNEEVMLCSVGHKDYGNCAKGVAPLQEEGVTIKRAQEMVDEWIHNIGGRYFSELTNMALLTEETGELARVIARVYGDQVAKSGDLRKGLSEEMADILWVLACLANQTGVDLTGAFLKSLEKKSTRDRDRFRK